MTSAFSARQLAELASDLGAERVSVKADKIQCSCLLARWTHSSGRDSKPSMVIYTEGHVGPHYSCLGCGEKGSLRDLVLFRWSKTGDDVNHFRVIEAIDGEVDPAVVLNRSEKFRRKVAEASRVGFKVTAPRPRPATTGHQVVRVGDGPFYDYQCIAQADEIEEIPWKVYEPYCDGESFWYPRERGISDEAFKVWQLGHDEAQARLLIPMFDHRGRLVAITGRLYACPKCRFRGEMDDEGNRGPIDYKPAPGERRRCIRCDAPSPPKYLHSKGFKRNLLLFGEHRRRQDVGKKVYLAEGHVDVILLWQAGYRPVVGLMGSNPGAAQIEKLVRYWPFIVQVPDGDPAGEKMAAAVKKKVAGRRPVTVRGCPPNIDPGDLATEYPEMLHKLLGDPPVSLD